MQSSKKIMCSDHAEQYVSEVKHLRFEFMEDRPLGSIKKSPVPKPDRCRILRSLCPFIALLLEAMAVQPSRSCDIAARGELPFQRLGFTPAKPV